MATPAYLGASVGSQAKAAQVNQFLGTHASTYTYTGTSQLSQVTAGTGGVNSNGLWIAQSFTTTGAFSATRVVLTLAVTGVPAPATISVQTSSGGAPSGTIVTGATISLPRDFVTGTAALISLPMAATLAATTTYWIVMNAVGDASNFFTWSKSNQVSGASTSTNGTTWAAQAYGLLYNVYSGTGGALVHTYEDSGAHWTSWAFTATGLVSKLSEYTVAQSANDYVASVRSFTYSNGELQTVA